jgi:hypothetical protein
MRNAAPWMASSGNNTQLRNDPELGSGVHPLDEQLVCARHVVRVRHTVGVGGTPLGGPGSWANIVYIVSARTRCRSTGSTVNLIAARLILSQRGCTAAAAPVR